MIRGSLHYFGHHIMWSISHIWRTGNETTNILIRIGASDSSFIEFV